MKPTALSFLVLVTLLTSLPAPAQLKLPPLRDREAGGAVASARGKVRWKNQWTMERVMIDGKPAIHFTETGKGIYSPFTDEVTWTTESWWSHENVFRPLRFDKTFTDGNGVALMRQAAEFDWSTHKVRFERNDLIKRKSKIETIEIPDDTLSVEGIAAALRSAPVVEGKKVTAHLLSNEPKLYEITLEFRGLESCRTSRGTEACYKIELVPHLGILSLFRFTLPKTFFWFSTQPTREWIRYDGLEAGRGTPEIVMEAVGD
jgi:hypothetical protein